MLKTKDMSDNICYYETVSSMQNEMICIYTKALRIKWVNEAYTKYFGFKKEALIGKSFLDFVPKSEQKKLKELHKNLLTTKEPISHIDEVIGSDGLSKWHEWKNSSIFDERGAFVEFRAVGNDITELITLKKQVEELKNINTQASDQHKTTLIGYKDNKQILLKISDISYFEANLKVSNAFVKSGTVSIPKSLARLEKELSNLGFFRIHRSHLVNIDMVDFIKPIQRSRFTVHFKEIDNIIESSQIGAKKTTKLHCLQAVESAQ